MNKELILYEIHGINRELEQKLADAPLDLEEEYNKDPKKRLGELLGELHSMKNEDEFMAEALAEHIKALQSRKQRMEQRIANTKNTILKAFEMCDIHKIKAPNGTISIVNRKAIRITDENALREHHPEYFITPLPKLNRNAAADDLKNGVILEGAQLEKVKTLAFRK